MSDKVYLTLMNQWFIYHQIGYKIESFFVDNKIKNIAIYGMGIYGRHLVRELEHSRIDILYGVDRKKLNPYKGVNIISSNEAFPQADAMVYTVLHDNSLKEWLQKKFPGKVYSIEEVIFNE